MPIPFLNPKKAVGVVISHRKGKLGIEVKSEQGGDYPDGLKEACEDILRAVDERSVLGMAAAIKAAFEICDAYPNEESNEEQGEE